MFLCDWCGKSSKHYEKPETIVLNSRPKEYPMRVVREGYFDIATGTGRPQIVDKGGIGREIVKVAHVHGTAATPRATSCAEKARKWIDFAVYGGMKNAGPRVTPRWRALWASAMVITYVNTSGLAAKPDDAFSVEIVNGRSADELEAAWKRMHTIGNGAAVNHHSGAPKVGERIRLKPRPAVRPAATQRGN